MSKKIKITEDQLKRIMVRNVNESEEVEVNELVTIPSVAGFAEGDAFKVAQTIKEKHSEMFNLNDGNLETYLEQFIESLKNELGVNQESIENDVQSTLPEPPSEEETENNQVYESITQNFKRFL